MQATGCAHVPRMLLRDGAEKSAFSELKAFGEPNYKGDSLTLNESFEVVGGSVLSPK